MPCYEIDGLRPVIDPTAFVHPDAVLIGDVIVGPRCYVAPTASLRGDFGRIILEAGSNLQDGCVMHDYPGADTVVEEDGHVGLRALYSFLIQTSDQLIASFAQVYPQFCRGPALQSPTGPGTPRKETGKERWG